jgi:hypothetical protein
MSTSTVLLWKEDGSTLTWDHFSWDQVVFIPTTMKRLKLGINNKSKALVLQLTDSVIAGATGKAELADSPVTLADLTLLRTEAGTALTNAVQAKEAWLMKRSLNADKFKTLAVGLRRFANHAHNVYAGDKTQLAVLGLDVVEITGELGVLPAPTNLRSRPGLLDGTVRVRWKSVRGTDIYVLECAEAASGPWTEAYRGSMVSATCDELEPGKEYFFRVRAWGTAGPGALSDITKTRAA